MVTIYPSYNLIKWNGDIFVGVSETYPNVGNIYLLPYSSNLFTIQNILEKVSVEITQEEFDSLVIYSL